MKLKHAGMEFAVWIFKHASDEQLKPMAQIILTGLVKLLDGQNPGETDSSSKQLRAFTYQAMGQLALRAPHLFNSNTDMAVRMFGALRNEPDSIRVTVQEALSSLAAAYKTCSPEVAKEVESLLLENARAPESEARFCSMLWATRLYPFSHAPSRFLCMLGAADVKLDIREMAQQGLTVQKSERENAEGENPLVKYPSLKSMMEYICQQQPQVLSRSPMGERTMLFPAKAYAAMITFVQQCYEYEQTTNENEKGKEELETGVLGDNQPEEALQLLLEHGMAIDGTADLQGTASTGLLDLAAVNPRKFAEGFASRLPWLKQYVGHVDSVTREAIARLLGIAVSGLTSQQGATLLQELLTSFRGVQKGRFEDLHGNICATGYVLAQCMADEPTIPESLLGDSFEALFEEMKNVNPSLAGSAAEAIGHVGLRKPLPIPAGDFSVDSAIKLARTTSGEATSSTKSTDTTVAKLQMESKNLKEKQSSEKLEEKEEKENLSLASVVKQLGVLLASKEVKVTQKAALALGHLCFGNKSPALASASLTALFTLSRSKAEDVLFSIGTSSNFPLRFCTKCCLCYL